MKAIALYNTFNSFSGTIASRAQEAQQIDSSRLINFWSSLDNLVELNFLKGTGTCSYVPVPCFRYLVTHKGLFPVCSNVDFKK
jgi:hypothetical protein